HHRRLPNLLPLGAGQPESLFLVRTVQEPHVHHSVRSRVRIRIHQDRVHHAEDRRGRPDAECQRSNRGERESWILEQLTQTITEVLKEGLHARSPEKKLTAGLHESSHLLWTLKFLDCQR